MIKAPKGQSSSGIRYLIAHNLLKGGKKHNIFNM